MPQAKKAEKGKLRPAIMVRVREDMFQAVTKRAAELGISRSLYIQQALVRDLGPSVKVSTTLGITPRRTA